VLVRVAYLLLFNSPICIFYLVVRVAHGQFYVFSISYSCACSLNDFYIYSVYFMHINVSGRSVLLFNKLIRRWVN